MAESGREGTERNREAQSGVRGPRASSSPVEASNEVSSNPRPGGRVSGAKATGDPKVSVVRPRDLLVLEFQFVNLGLLTEIVAGGGQLERINPDQPAYVVARFQPQSIAEQAFYEYAGEITAPTNPSPSETLGTPPVQSRLSRQSRLVFTMPDNVSSIPYTLDGVLTACGEWPLSDSFHEFPPLSSPTAPPSYKTAIELPYRLILSPNRSAVWAHSKHPVTHNGRTELWHTRLEARPGVRDPKALQAVWTPDYDKPAADVHNELPFRTSLTPLDRELLVRATVGSLNQPGLPTRANRLMLSALGGWLDTEGAWPEEYLEGWAHRATMGRDHYVRVVYKGFLFPFGHAASLVKVTERKFNTSSGQQRIAYLRQRFFIVVREPEKTYPGQYQEYGGRQFPFERVRITTRVTPNLDPPGTGVGAVLGVTALGYSDQDAFWPRVGEADFQFHLVAEDLAGRRVDFTAPLMFLSIAPKPNGDDPLAYTEEAIEKAIEAYDSTDEARRRRPFLGQGIRFAPSEKPGDTSFETVEIMFGGQEPMGNPPSDIPRFYPCLQRANLRVPALQRLLGDPTSADMSYPQTYLTNEFGPANRGHVFLALNQALGVNFGANNNGDKAGGLVTPNLSVTGLSRRVGPIGGPINNIANAEFKPEDFFGGADAKILGGLSLWEILKPLTGVFGNPNGSELVPRLSTRQVDNTIETQLSWHTTELKSDLLNLFVPLSGTSRTSLDITATATSPLGDGVEPDTSVDATLKNFKINMFGFIIVWFDELRFETRSGRKPDVTVDLHEGEAVAFGGPLEFVNELKEYIPIDGFSDPPDLAVTDAGLKASYSLGLPDIAVGIFSLQNVGLGAGLNLPFTGEAAAVRFNFSERHDPFNLTVSLFGGGGFFALAVDSGGVQELEAALEFGASISVNLGVASGGVYVKAGIYFHWEDDEAELSGYLDMGGELSVLGLISVSLKFYMSMTYTSEGKVWGQATLLVEIDLVLFSETVEITVERQFKGSDSDPSFEALIPSDEVWAKYCEAFAPEGGTA